MRRRSTVQFIPSRVTSVVERAMALVKESVTDRHQFTLRVSVDTGLMAYITDLVERAMAPMALVTQQSVMDPIDSCPE